MEENEKFARRTSTWSVVSDGDEVTIRHQGQLYTRRPLAELPAVAESLAGVVKRTILAMPKNGSKEIQLNCSWE